MVVMVGVITGTLAIMLLWAGKIQREVNERGGCPNCGIPVPTFRHPTSLRQALWGGWTCSNCGTEMDRGGRELAANSPRT
jgi:hypothetical protein